MTPVSPHRKKVTKKRQFFWLIIIFSSLSALITFFALSFAWYFHFSFLILSCLVGWGLFRFFYRPKQLRHVCRQANVQHNYHYPHAPRHSCYTYEYHDSFPEQRTDYSPHLMIYHSYSLDADGNPLPVGSALWQIDKY